MNSAVFLCGLPGSGKSTFRKRLLSSRPDFILISSDDVIDRIALSEGKTYSDVFDEAIKSAEQETRETFRDAIARRQNIIIDRTNMSRKSRANYLRQVPNDYLCGAITFEVDPDLLTARLQARAQATGKFIPTHVVHSMRANYQRPDTDEFDYAWISNGEDF